MTTSNSTLWELDRDALIAAAMRKFGELAKGQAPDAEDLANGTEALNAVVAELQTLGMPLWARKEYTFSPTVAIDTYSIGVGQSLNTPFPLKIYQAALIDSNSGSNIEMEINSIYEYNRIYSGSSSGQPIQLFYTPKINVGEIKLWPKPDATSASTKTIKLVYQRPFEDFVSATDTMDFPKEWTQTIIYKLAAALAPEYGVPLEDRQLLMKEAQMHEDRASSFGADETSVYFMPMDR